MRMTESLVHCAVRAYLKRCGWLLVAGQFPGGTDEDYCYKIGKPSKTFIAEWDTYGKAAGPIRNRQMAEYADELLLIWDGKSRGSASMKREMERLGKPVWEFVVGDA